MSGPQAYLTKEEEDEPVHFLVECAQFGFPRTRKQVISIAQSVARQRHDCVECPVAGGKVFGTGIQR